MFRAFIALAVAALIGACTQVHSNISAYSNIDSGYQGKTIVILPLDDAQANSMEFRDYTRRVEGRFAQKGLRPVSLEQAKVALPDYVAFFDFGVDNGQQVARTYSIPTYGQTGVSSSYSTGTLSMYGNQGHYSGTTTYNPTYGITGYQTGTAVDTIYARAVTLDIYKPMTSDKLDKVYEAKLTSSGSCGNMAGVMDSLLDALFQDFPAQASGSVSVPFNGEC